MSADATLTDTNAALLLAEFGRDIAVLRWPAQSAERDDLARREIPRLLVIENGVAPPTPPNGHGCLEDWVRLPAEPEDIRARLVALHERAEHHLPVPVVDAFGQLGWRGARVQLSPTAERLVVPLVAHFGTAVSEAELLAAGWPDGSGNASALRVQLSRLRRRLSPLGLEIRARRGLGHVLQADR